MQKRRKSEKHSPFKVILPRSKTHVSCGKPARHAGTRKHFPESPRRSGDSSRRFWDCSGVQSGVTQIPGSFCNSPWVYSAVPTLYAGVRRFPGSAGVGVIRGRKYNLSWSCFTRFIPHFHPDLYTRLRRSEHGPPRHRVGHGRAQVCH